MWEFHTIPQKGEPGYETWLNGSAEYTGNTGVWTEITADAQAGLAYLPVESPDQRLLWRASPWQRSLWQRLVAVDLKTGKVKWYFQLIHHEIWDYDIAAAPLLIDITVDGKPIKAVAEPTKQGYLYVFDRFTGKPVWPIPERRVPKGDVPGEWYAPTQPIPSQAGCLRAHRSERGRSDRFHPCDAQQSAGTGEKLQARADLHAAGAQREAGAARHFDVGTGEWRHQLAGWFIQSRKLTPSSSMPAIPA